MSNYTTVKFNPGERVALTVTNEGLVQKWGTFKTDTCKVFADKRGNKAILYLSSWDFEETAKSAPYCKYIQLWYGEFPYGSWCWAIRKCSVTNEVEISTICTDINPRGMSESDYWTEKCKSYVPDSVVADLVAT